MKIGFLGNTNNYPFMIAHALKKMGHDVLIFVTQTYSLHRPENRYSELAPPYPEWIIDVAPIDDSEYVIPNEKRAFITEKLRGCDLLFLNHLGPSLLHQIERPAVCILTGSDLDYYADYKNIDNFNCAAEGTGVLSQQEVWKQLGRKLITHQRQGIAAAQLVRYFPRGVIPKADDLLDEIGVKDESRIFFMMSDPDLIPLVPPSNNSPLRILCATRLNWKKPIARGMTELDYKGSDIMIRGLAQFHKETRTCLDIRLFKKGLHVEETMELIEKEGLRDQVTWSDEVSQTEILEEFKKADIIFEQFGQSMLGMAGLDALMMGRPVIANARIDSFQYPEGFPICQAAAPEEVSSQLKRLVFDPQERETVGQASREYMKKHYSAQTAAQFCLSKMDQAIFKK